MTDDPQPLHQSVRDAYLDATSQASSGVRALAVSVLAVCWLFLGGTGDSPAQSESLKSLGWFSSALLLAVLSLILDLLQYLITGELMRRYYSSIDAIFVQRIAAGGVEDIQSGPWRRAARWGITSHYLSVLELYDLEADENSEVANIKLSQAVASAGQDDNVDLQEKVNAAQAQPWFPTKVVRLPRRFFYLKAASLLVASVLLGLGVYFL